MDTIIDCTTEIDRFEGGATGIVAELHPYEDEMEYFSYDHRFIPERAKYPVAVFRMRIAVSKESENITPELLPSTSAQEFDAKFVDESDSDYLRFELYDEEDLLKRQRTSFRRT